MSTYQTPDEKLCSDELMTELTSSRGVESTVAIEDSVAGLTMVISSCVAGAYAPLTQLDFRIVAII